MKFEKIKHFKCVQMTDNQIRSVYGGTQKTAVSDDCLDYIDNCDVTTYCDGLTNDDTPALQSPGSGSGPTQGLGGIPRYAS